MNWEYILYSSAVVIIFMVIYHFVIYQKQVQQYKQQFSKLQEMQNSVQVGQRVLFNQMVAKVIAVNSKYVTLELGDGVQIEALKFGISGILPEDSHTS